MTTIFSEPNDGPSAAADQPPAPAQNDGATSPAASGSALCNVTLVLDDFMELELQPMPPKPEANEVTLATHTVGICGSNCGYWLEGKNMKLGSETSAVVLGVGAGVRALQPGDRVAVHGGNSNQRLQLPFATKAPFDETIPRYFNYPADLCFKLPETVSLEEGALLEPLAQAVHACQQAAIHKNDVVLVCCAGAVDLLVVQSARAFGAWHVIVTDVSEERLVLARQLGASATLLVEPGATTEHLAARVRAQVAKFEPEPEPDRNRPLAEGPGVDVVLECTGSESALELAIRAAAVGCQIVCVAPQSDRVTLAFNCALMQEVEIRGASQYRDCYPSALSLVEAGKIYLRSLITHRFYLSAAADAFEMCSRGDGLQMTIECLDEELSLEELQSAFARAPSPSLSSAPVQESERPRKRASARALQI